MSIDTFLNFGKFGSEADRLVICASVRLDATQLDTHSARPEESAAGFFTEQWRLRMALTGMGMLAGANYADGYAEDTTPTAVERNGLVRLADQIAEAAARVDQIAMMLSGLSVGIHGPRPEPVGDQKSAPPHADSLSSRVGNLLSAIDRLQRSYESVVR